MRGTRSWPTKPRRQKKHDLGMGSTHHSLLICYVRTVCKKKKAFPTHTFTTGRRIFKDRSGPRVWTVRRRRNGWDGGLLESCVAEPDPRRCRQRMVVVGDVIRRTTGPTSRRPAAAASFPRARAWRHPAHGHVRGWWVVGGGSRAVAGTGSLLLVSR